MIADVIEKYALQSHTSLTNTPFFLVVGDAQYLECKNTLLDFGFSFRGISDYCGSEDKRPNLDRLMEDIKSAHENTSNHKIAVVGLGEYLALDGQAKAQQFLLRLKETNINSAKVIFLLRGLNVQVQKLCEEDSRLDDRHVYFADDIISNISIVYLRENIFEDASVGLKKLLKTFENGKCGTEFVVTQMDFSNSLLNCRRINSSYDLITSFCQNFTIPESYGTEEQWENLFCALHEHGMCLTSLFKSYSFNNEIDSKLFYNTVISDKLGWLYFIFLKYNYAHLTNSYLRHVLDNTNFFKDFKDNVLSLIIQITPPNTNFQTFYDERKKLVESFPDAELSKFVILNRKYMQDSIFKLSDNTTVERNAILEWIAQCGIPQNLPKIYPKLTSYLSKYYFKNTGIDEKLTQYFDKYKKQKVTNKIEQDFLETVNTLAQTRCYNRLRAREEVIEQFNVQTTHLCWIDALGVEYLALISDLAQRHGLSIKIDIAQSILPTITSINRKFYDDWSGSKEKISKLDSIKHKHDGNYNFLTEELPVHLVEEIDIIANIIDNAAVALYSQKCESFLIVSDHGASRLAVLHKKEEKYDTGTKGEHSGRCCKVFEPCDLPFAAVENGYIVLADYGRFKGSRAANVEVHGGASLEEVVIPIIELTLRDTSVKVELIDKNIIADKKSGIQVTLFISKMLNNVSVIINEKKYIAISHNNNNYFVNIPDIVSAGTYSANIFSSDDLIGKVDIKVRGKSASINSSFDELF